jgi:hypothetical protein
MMVYQEFRELPPKPFVLQITDTLTKAYCFLWEKKDAKNKLSMTWKEISQSYNKNTFRTSLRKLNNEGLLNYDESNEGISIELVGWEDIED